jgi:CO/xanthine dehydrogenase FAD-binding subunit
MKPRPFNYLRPDTIEETVALLAEYGEDARVLAGGQSLVPMLNLRLIEADALVDISQIAALDIISDRGDKIEIGAAVTQNKLLAWPQLAEKLPLLAAALPHVGHFQTRNKGTVCGSIAHADPSSELPLALARCSFRRGGNPASPFAKWRGGTATSLSSPSPRLPRIRKMCGSASAAWPAGRWCGGSR